jgi:hypothetical protein
MVAGPSKPANGSGRAPLTIGGFGNSLTCANTDPTETSTDPTDRRKGKEPETGESVSEMKSTKFSTERLKAPEGAVDIEVHPVETAAEIQSKTWKSC